MLFRNKLFNRPLLAWIALMLSGTPFAEAPTPADRGQVKGHRDLSAPLDPIERPSLSSNSEAREAASTDEDLLGNGERSPARAPGIVVSGDRLSVHVKDRSLRAILNEISRKSGLSIVSAQTTQIPRVSSDFKDLALDDGLKRLLSDYDTFFFFGASSNSTPVTLKAVWVYRKGQGAIQASIQNKRIEREHTLAESLADQDPDRRAQAVESEIRRNGSSTLDLVVEALKDPDDQVRYRALSMALGKGVNLPADLLQELMQSDASENVRFMALSGIVANTDIDREDLRSFAESAVNDVDPVVQTKALEILDHLQTGDRQPISGEPFHEM